jgi:16S rRNA (adenine1518-N6/adenine1519-N6)-dimethyltransferase
MLDAVSARPDQHLVEVGPGQGAITAGLLQAAGLLDVIELDRDLVGPLADRLSAATHATAGERRSGPRLRIHNADALTFDLCALVERTPSTRQSPSSPPVAPLADSESRPQRLRLVGNLPYNISTPLLFRFLAQAECIEDMHLMLQKEVVDRIIAAPGSKVFGRLSVMVQSYCDAERLFVVAPGAFAPAPKVSSAVVRLIPQRPARVPIADRDRHGRIVAAAFAQRRKTLRNSLAGLIGPEQMMALGIDPSARAETLSVAAFAALANAEHGCIDSQIP